MGITLATSAEAETLKRLLDANNQSFEIAQHAMVKNQTKAPTVAAVIQEHIDLLVRPSVGTVHTLFFEPAVNESERSVIGKAEPVLRLPGYSAGFTVVHCPLMQGSAGR